MMIPVGPCGDRKGGYFMSKIADYTFLFQKSFGQTA
ncbi:unknown [Clostridium sp. CAG:230]|nr:unknown [Clostridium sp. CAG:230]